MLTRELVEGMRQRARPEALDRLRRTLALGEVAKQEGIKIEEEALQEKIKEAMAEVEDPSQIDPDRLTQVLTEELLQEKILTWLEENNTVELVAEGTLQKAEAEVAEVNAAEATVEVVATAADDADEEPEAQDKQAAAKES
jgi:trigger factor